MSVEIGERIRALRTARGLSQEEVARRTGIGLKSYGDLERGRTRDPHYSTLRGVSRALDIRVEELLAEPVAAGKAEAPPSVSLGEDPRGAGDLDLEWLPGYLRFLKQHTESMRTRWEAAIKENTVEPGAWYEAAEVAMELAKSCVETIPPPLYATEDRGPLREEWEGTVAATEDRGPLREEWEGTVADALGSLSMLNTTLDMAYHVCERRLGEKGDLNVEDLDRDKGDKVVDLRRWIQEQHGRFLEVPKLLKAGAG